MNRNQFIRNTLLSFASILLPEVLRPMDVTGKCVFDEKKINERLEYLRQYPLEQKDCFSYSFFYYDGEKTVSTQDINEFLSKRKPNPHWMEIRDYTYGKPS